MRFPPVVVRARGLSVKDPQIKLLLSEETWNIALRGGDGPKLGQYMNLVQTGLDHLGSVGLLRAHALWQGLKRPLGGEVSAPHHYAYILKSERTWVLARLPGGQVGYNEEAAPKDAVFMVTVEIPPASDRRLEFWSATATALENADVKISGMVHDWDWFTADGKQGDQPDRPALRFEQRHW